MCESSKEGEDMPKIGERDLPAATRRKVQELRQQAGLPTRLSWGQEVTITEHTSGNPSCVEKLPCVGFEIDGLHWQNLNVPEYVDDQRFSVHWAIGVDSGTGKVSATARPLVMPVSTPGMPSAQKVSEIAMGCYTVDIGHVDPSELKVA